MSSPEQEHEPTATILEFRRPVAAVAVAPAEVSTIPALTYAQKQERLATLRKELNARILRRVKL